MTLLAVAVWRNTDQQPLRGELKRLLAGKNVLGTTAKDAVGLVRRSG